jgi:hypothetical protein
MATLSEQMEELREAWRELGRALARHRPLAAWWRLGVRVNRWLVEHDPTLWRRRSGAAVCPGCGHDPHTAGYCVVFADPDGPGTATCACMVDRKRTEREPHPELDEREAREHTRPSGNVHRL